jgi:hypothetical protein
VPAQSVTWIEVTIRIGIVVGIRIVIIVSARRIIARVSGAPISVSREASINGPDGIPDIVEAPASSGVDDL